MALSQGCFGWQGSQEVLKMCSVMAYFRVSYLSIIVGSIVQYKAP